MSLNPQPRRISLVTRTMKPVQQQIGKLQAETAFLAARGSFAARLPNNRVSVAEVEEKRRTLADLLQLFDASVLKLPEKLRRDTRLHSIEAAIQRLDQSLQQLEAEAGDHRPPLAATPREPASAPS